jgi:flagellar motor switch protein FliN
MSEQQTDTSVSSSTTPSESSPISAAEATQGAPNFLAAPLLMDIKLPIRVRMGGKQLSLRAITQLASGSVIELDCSADDPVQIVVNDRIIAEGEVVVVSGNYGVRVTRLAGASAAPQVASAEQQLRSLSDRLK